jgi:hypothetical protein
MDDPMDAIRSSNKPTINMSKWEDLMCPTDYSIEINHH